MLVPNWRAVLRRAWSIRLIVLSIVLQGVDIIMQITVGQMPDVSWPLRIAAGLSAMAAFGARLIPQKGISNE
jgi:hypothetical protein